MKNLTRQVRGQTQKDLVRLFDHLAQRHSRWEVWADFVYMTAVGFWKDDALVAVEHVEKVWSDRPGIYNPHTEVGCPQ